MAEPRISQDGQWQWSDVYSPNGWYNLDNPGQYGGNGAEPVAQDNAGNAGGAIIAGPDIGAPEGTYFQEIHDKDGDFLRYQQVTVPKNERTFKNPDGTITVFDEQGQPKLTYGTPTPEKPKEYTFKNPDGTVTVYDEQGQPKTTYGTPTPQKAAPGADRIVPRADGSQVVVDEFGRVKDIIAAPRPERLTPDLLMAQAFMDGNWGAAQQIFDFVSQPTFTEQDAMARARFQQALQIAQSPADYLTVVGMMRGEIPIEPGQFGFRVGPQAQTFGFGAPSLYNEGAAPQFAPPAEQPSGITGEGVAALLGQRRADEATAAIGRGDFSQFAPPGSAETPIPLPTFNPPSNFESEYPDREFTEPASFPLSTNEGEEFPGENPPFPLGKSPFANPSLVPQALTLRQQQPAATSTFSAPQQPTGATSPTFGRPSIAPTGSQGSTEIAPGARFGSLGSYSFGPTPQQRAAKPSRFGLPSFLEDAYGAEALSRGEITRRKSPQELGAPPFLSAQGYSRLTPEERQLRSAGIQLQGFNPASFRELEIEATGAGEPNTPPQFFRPKRRERR